MEVGEARAVLGVGAEARWEEVRTAYRRLLRRHHPDVAVGVPAATATTARIVAAFGALRAERSARSRQGEDAVDGTAAATPAPGGPPADEGDTLVLPAPADEAFLALLEAVQEVGEATYVDAEVGLLETIVGSGPGACSLVVSLQGRSNGTTEAFVTLEPLGQGPPPPLAPIVAELARRARARL